MEGFEWVAELKDSVSGPAGGVRRSLDQVKASLGGADEALTRLEGHGGAAGFFEELQSSMVGNIAAGELVAEAIKKIGEYALEAIVKVGELGIEFAKTAIEANEFKRRTQEMFIGLAGSEEAGMDTYNMLQRLRTVLPESEKDLAKWTASLMAAGDVDPARLNNSLIAMASASALLGGKLGGGAEAAAKVQNIITRSLEAGKLKVPVRSLFAGTGLTVEDVATQLGWTPEHLRAAIKSGIVPAQQGIDAMNAALIAKGGGPMRAAMMDLGTQVDKSKENFSHLFDGLDFGPVLGTFASLTSELDVGGASATTLKTSLHSVFQGLINISAKAIDAVHVGFLELEVAALKLWLALRPIEPALEAAFGVQMHMNLNLVRTLFRQIAADAAILGYTLDKIAAVKTFMTGEGHAPPGLKPKGFGERETGAWHAPMAEPTGLEPPPLIARPHARGGLVAKPAPGEYFASVQPGEEIRPRGADLEAAGGDVNHNTQVDVGGIHIHGHVKEEEIPQLLEHAVADVFERMAREMGGTT